MRHHNLDTSEVFSGPSMDRKQQPVFVMGCHRSGTNLLYDNLQSSGGFAVYRAYLPVYETLLPRFGKFSVRENRKRLMDGWLRSKMFRRSGLDPAHIEARVLAECRTGGDFIRIVMEEVARNQNARRWAAYGPDNVLFVRQIKREIPDALFVHIIRDGRDIAVTLTKMGGLRPLPWDQAKARLATALYWQWMVRKGRENGEAVAPDYYEVHYEDLVTRPAETLAKLGEFIDHDLNYERIQKTGIGRVSDPNSSFKAEPQSQASNPIGRWKTMLSQQEVTEIESLIGECLRNVGYPTSTTGQASGVSLHAKIMGAIYAPYFETKLWAKSHTPLGRFASLDFLEIEEPAAQKLEARS
ncbi:MAG: sulfotransferase [Terriglobia bacterium]